MLYLSFQNDFPNFSFKITFQSSFFTIKDFLKMLKCLSDILLLSFCMYLMLLCLYAFLLPHMFFCAFCLSFSYCVSIPCSHVYLAVFSYMIFCYAFPVFLCSSTVCISYWVLKFCLPSTEPCFKFLLKDSFKHVFLYCFFYSHYTSN